MSQFFVQTISGGGTIPVPVSVVNGGTGNSGSGELTINPMQSVFGIVDATVIGLTTIFTFPSRFNIISITLQSIAITGIPDFSSADGNCGTNNPSYDNFISNDDMDLPLLFDIENFSQPDDFNIPTAGSVAAGIPVIFNVTSPVLTATVYQIRVYLNGFYY